jgi:hypothetical protein
MLNLLRVYEDTCFGHVLFKACQYATNDDKIFNGFEANKCERCPNRFTKNNYLDKSGKEAIMGENVC